MDALYTWSQKLILYITLQKYSYPFIDMQYKHQYVLFYEVDQHKVENMI